MFYAVTSMWSMVYFVGLIHLSVDLCDSQSSNQPWKVTIPGFLLRGRIVWGWILEIQWSLSSWNKLGSLQRQLQVWFKLVVDHGDKGKRKNLQCSICLEISMLRALAGDWRVWNCFCAVMFSTGPLYEACKIAHILHHWNSSMRVRYQHEFYQKTGNILMLVMRAQGSGIGEGFAGSKESQTCIFLVLCFWYRQLRFRFSNWHHFLWNSCCRLKKSVFVSESCCCINRILTTYRLVFMSYAHSNANRYPRAPSPDSRNVTEM
jgi:hypothetical protein